MSKLADQIATRSRHPGGGGGSSAGGGGGGFAAAYHQAKTTNGKWVRL